jgi:hypothetical protein
VQQLFGVTWPGGVPSPAHEPRNVFGLLAPGAWKPDTIWLLCQ